MIVYPGGLRFTFTTPLLTSGKFLAFRVESVLYPEYLYDSGLNQADSAITTPDEATIQCNSPGCFADRSRGTRHSMQ